LYVLEEKGVPARQKKNPWRMGKKGKGRRQPSRRRRGNSVLFQLASYGSVKLELKKEEKEKVLKKPGKKSLAGGEGGRAGQGKTPPPDRDKKVS